MQKLLFVVNDAAFFVSHRLPIATAAIRAGYEVHLAAPRDEAIPVVQSAGIEVHDFGIARGHATAAAELRSVRTLLALYRRLRPTLVHHVTVKPVLYGSIAARAAGIPGVVNAISGLGFAFLDRGMRAALRRYAILNGYRVGFRHPRLRVIFQNRDDRDLFVSRNIVRDSQTILIHGSGVDLSTFTVVDEPPGTPIVMLPARVLWHKGVGEFVNAAAQLRHRGIGARFVIVGDVDRNNPSGVPEPQIRKWSDDGIVEWWGPRRDMPFVLGQATIVCLPSYREGLPKVLQEAAACGRAIVTTDAPGCRDVVRDGENGRLVPVADARALADAIEWMLSHPEERRRMARRSREIAEAECDVRHVAEQTVNVYRELMAAGPSGLRRKHSSMSRAQIN